jgi:anti-sigma regulatory factor (Ser/Thr protein kinase)
MASTSAHRRPGDRRDRSVVLRPTPSSAAAARRFVAGALEELGASGSRDVGELLASELVTNAVLYAQGRIVVRVHTDDGGGTIVRVEVEDESSAPVRERHVGVEATSGRGLSLVRQLASRWGVEQTDGDGKVVWFELPRV